MKIYTIFLRVPTQSVFDYTIFRKIYHQPDLESNESFFQDHEITCILYAYSTDKDLATEFMKQRIDLFYMGTEEVTKAEFHQFEESYDKHRLSWELFWTKRNITCSILCPSFEFSYIMYDMFYDEVLKFELVEEFVDPEIFEARIENALTNLGYDTFCDMILYGGSYDMFLQTFQVDHLQYFITAFGNTFERSLKPNEML